MGTKEVQVILKTGTTFPELREKEGDFENWIMDRFGGPGNWLIVDYTSGETLDQKWDQELNLRGVIITGAHESVNDDLPWFNSIRGDILKLSSMNVPILGICFGHQLLGKIIGGRVAPHPFGFESYLAEVRLTDAGKKNPLFRSLPDSLIVYESHQDVIISLPDGCEILAYNEHTSIQAFHYRNLMGVQFHPEFNNYVAEFYQREMDLNGTDIRKEVIELAEVERHNKLIMKNFLLLTTGEDDNVNISNY